MDKKSQITDEINPEWTDSMFEESISSKEFFAKKLGRPIKENKKVAISLRIDPELLEIIKATGAGWQGRIHQALETNFRK